MTFGGPRGVGVMSEVPLCLEEVAAVWRGPVVRPLCEPRVDAPRGVVVPARMWG